MPGVGLPEILAGHRERGYRKLEAFSSWARAAFDLEADPAAYAELAGQFGMSYCSLHLPPVGDDHDTSAARRGLEVAAAPGIPVALFKATSRPNYIAAGQDVLDAAENLGVRAVVQNHAGTAISTLADYREVLDGIADERLGAVLEVGHFHTAGQSWEAGFDLLADRIALVHVKDQVGKTPVAFGEGEIDLHRLFERLLEIGYDGDIVVEMEVCSDDVPRTWKLLEAAQDYLGTTLAEVKGSSNE